MATIRYFDDASAGDYTQPEYQSNYEPDSQSSDSSPSYGAYQAPPYQPEASRSSGSFSSYPNTGITGLGDLSQFLNQNQPQQTQYKPWDFNTFQQDAQRIAGGYSGSLDDFVNHIFPQLSQQYQGLERFGSKGDKIRLPNGEVIDAVISAGLGGRGYNWAPESPTSGAGYASDPLIGQYIDRMNGLIDRLSQPQPINPTLQSAIDRLSGPQTINPTLQGVMDRLSGPQTINPTLQGAIDKLSGPQTIDPVLQDAITKLQGMFANPGYTDAQRALMRTNLQEPLESQRAAGQQRVLERASNRGLGLGSGVIEQEAQGVDRGFDRMLGEALRQMSVNEIEQQNAIRSNSVGQLAGIGQGLQGQNLQRQTQLAGIGQGLQAGDLSRLFQLGGIGQGLQNDDLQRQVQLAGIGSGLQGQELQALAQALGGTSQLGQLPIQLQQAQIAAMNALNQQRIPQQDDMNGLIGLLMGLAGQGENAYNNALGQEGGFWQSLFGQIPNMVGAVRGETSNQYGVGGKDAGDLYGDVIRGDYEHA